MHNIRVYACSCFNPSLNIYIVFIFLADITRDRDSQPQIAELYHDVVPKYAIYWEDLGVKLGLKDHHIDAISQNNAFNPNRTVDCCKSMLKKWLQIDSGATWGKLRDAINLVSKKGKYSRISSYKRCQRYNS